MRKPASRELRLVLAMAAGPILWSAAAPIGLPAQERGQRIVVHISETMQRLLADEDTDGDKKITVDDKRIGDTERGDKRFVLAARDGSEREVDGTYYLSNLLQELSLLTGRGSDTGSVALDRIFEKPTDRISRQIREIKWNGLTRYLDEKGLQLVLRDEKSNTIDGRRYLYVPSSDVRAFSYFDSIGRSRPEFNLQVVRLPEMVTPDYVRSLDGLHGILTLALTPGPDSSLRAVPYVVPGGRFNEMYGWDSYFIGLGLLLDGRLALARGLADNMVYELDHYGKILNANRSYYLTRSQPPFLTSLALACFDAMPKDSNSLEWLRTTFRAAIREYRTVWMGPDHLTPIGLSRYYDRGWGPPPEVEPGHFARVFSRYAKEHAMSEHNYERAYTLGLIDEPGLDDFFSSDRAMRESGHDTSYRLYGRCAHLATVDLNSLLYKIEMDIARTIESRFGGSLVMDRSRIETPAAWYERAARRRALMNEYLWDPNRGMFFDYDLQNGMRIPYESATMFYPLWAGVATPEQAATLVSRALPLLEVSGGIAGSSERSRGPITPDHPLRQWDYPYGWSPHQMLIWSGLKDYGFEKLAQRLAYKWLFTITHNAIRYNGTIPEKFDVVRRSHDVFAEYGNVGTKFSYITREGFGWTNASYLVGLQYLNPELRGKLDNDVSPEDLFRIQN